MEQSPDTPNAKKLLALGIGLLSVEAAAITIDATDTLGLGASPFVYAYIGIAGIGATASAACFIVQHHRQQNQ